MGGMTESKIQTKSEPLKKKEDMPDVGKGKPDSLTSKSSEVRCFNCLGIRHIASQCLNRYTMILREDGRFEFEEETNEESKQTLGDDEKDVEYPVTRELLMTRKILSVQVKEEVDEVVQCDNIFHTRCHIEDKVCSMVIDAGNCKNVASTELPTIKHPRSYMLQWLNSSGELKVTKQVMVHFLLGNIETRFFVMLCLCMWVIYY